MAKQTETERWIEWNGSKAAKQHFGGCGAGQRAAATPTEATVQRHDCGGPAPQWAVRVQTACPGWSSASLAGAIRWRAGGRGLPTGACPPPKPRWWGVAGRRPHPVSNKRPRRQQNKTRRQHKPNTQIRLGGGLRPVAAADLLKGDPRKRKLQRRPFLVVVCRTVRTVFGPWH